MDKLKKEKYKTYVFLFIAIGLPLIAYFTGMSDHFTRSNIKNFVESYTTLAPLVYIIAMVFLPIIGAPRLILTAVGGALFSLEMGTVYAMIGSTLAGVLGYYLAYYSAANYFEAVTTNKKSRLLSALDFTKKNNFWLIFLSRICPITHYEAINYICGTSKIPFRSFFWSTFFGIMPGTFVYVMMGDAIMEISDKKGIMTVITEAVTKGNWNELMLDPNVRELFWVGVLLFGFLIFTLSGFYYIIKSGNDEGKKEAEAPASTIKTEDNGTLLHSKAIENAESISTSITRDQTAE